MSSSRLFGAAIVLSLAWSASAQSTTQKPKPQKKAAAPAKPVERAPTATPAPATDVKVHTKSVNGAQASESTTYMKGVRQRFEFPGVTMITQCDLQRSVQLHDATKHFLVVPNEPPAPPPAAEAAAGAAGAAKAKPQGDVITETTTLTDTGERKQLFGREARHITTVTLRQPGPKACDPRTTKIEIDGWYADLPERASCPVPAAAPPSSPAAQQACTDRIETRQAGDAKLGFPLSTSITTTIEEGKDKDLTKDVTTATMEVTDLQVTRLDAKLFDVPAGYTEVKSYEELLPSLSSGGTLADAVFGSISDGTSTVAPKKPGVIRVGIVDPIDNSGRTMSAPMLRGGLSAPLNKEPFETLSVGGATAADLDRDASGKACDFILVANIAEVKASKPNKVGGALRRVSGDPNGQNEVYDARVDYKVYAVGDQAKPKITATVKASSSGGFGVGSALRVAAFAGQMYMTTMTMGMGMGMGGMGMMGPASFASLGGMSGLGGGMAGMMNPGMAAMSVMSRGGAMGRAGGMAGMGGMPGMGHMPGAGGMGDPGDQKAAETVQDALSKAGKQVAEELKKSRSTASSEKK